MKMIERWTVIALLGLLSACGRQASDENSAKAVAANEVTLPQAKPAAQPSGREPIAYTSLKPGDCRLIEENIQEGTYSRQHCPGVGGFALETSESDLRQDIVVIAPDGKRSELGLSGIVAKGAFNALGPVAEWRGTDKAAPSALIVRLGVAKGAEPNQPDTSNLVVVKLSAPACIIAVIPPGPGQNDLARDRADNLPGTCLAA
jgi:hypothetical protein